MTEDVPFYVELARETDGPLVELAVGNGRVAIPVARETGRPVLGIDSCRRCWRRRASGPTPQGSSSSSGSATCGSSSWTSRRALIYVPFRSLAPPADLGRPAPHVRARHAVAPPGRPLRLELRSASTRGRGRDRAASGRNRTGSAHRVHHVKHDNRHRHHARDRRHDLALVADRNEWLGLIDVAGLRGRGALRRLRPASRSTRTANEFVWVVAQAARPYDPIAGLYDPWSAVVTEDVEFYVEEALASRRARRRARVSARAGSRCRSPQAGIDVIGVDSSAGMLEVAASARPRQPASRPAARPPPRRPARAAGRRARAARPDPVPLPAPHDDRGRPAASAARRTRAARAGRPARLRRLRPEPRGHRRRRTAAGSSASPASSSAPTGTRRADADPVGPARRGAVDDAASPGSRRPEWRRLLDAGGLRGRGELTAGSTAGRTGGGEDIDLCVAAARSSRRIA